MDALHKRTFHWLLEEDVDDLECLSVSDIISTAFDIAKEYGETIPTTDQILIACGYAERDKNVKFIKAYEPEVEERMSLIRFVIKNDGIFE